MGGEGRGFCVKMAWLFAASSAFLQTYPPRPDRALESFGESSDLPSPGTSRPPSAGTAGLPSRICCASFPPCISQRLGGLKCPHQPCAPNPDLAIRHATRVPIAFGGRKKKKSTLPTPLCARRGTLGPERLSWAPGKKRLDPKNNLEEKPLGHGHGRCGDGDPAGCCAQSPTQVDPPGGAHASIQGARPGRTFPGHVAGPARAPDAPHVVGSRVARTSPPHPTPPAPRRGPHVSSLGKLGSTGPVLPVPAAPSGGLPRPAGVVVVVGPPASLSPSPFPFPTSSRARPRGPLGGSLSSPRAPCPEATRDARGGQGEGPESLGGGWVGKKSLFS